MSPVSVTAGSDGLLRVTFQGEIDYTNAAAVTEVIRSAMAKVQPTLVRIDLGEVTFLDSSGIGVLVSGLKMAQAADAGFRVWGPNPKVLDQLRITGLAELFQVEVP
jgi:anti-sigma B factor antagonist